MFNKHLANEIFKIYKNSQRESSEMALLKLLLQNLTGL